MSVQAFELAEGETITKLVFSKEGISLTKNEFGNLFGLRMKFLRPEVIKLFQKDEFNVDIKTHGQFFCDELERAGDVEDHLIRPFVNQVVFSKPTVKRSIKQKIYQGNSADFWEHSLRYPVKELLAGRILFRWSFAYI